VTTDNSSRLAPAGGEWSGVRGQHPLHAFTPVLTESRYLTRKREAGEAGDTPLRADHCEDEDGRRRGHSTETQSRAPKPGTHHFGHRSRGHTISKQTAACQQIPPRRALTSHPPAASSFAASREPNCAQRPPSVHSVAGSWPGTHHCRKWPGTHHCAAEFTESGDTPLTAYRGHSTRNQHRNVLLSTIDADLTAVSPVELDFIIALSEWRAGRLTGEILA